MITGPIAIVNFDTLARFFQENIAYQLEKVETVNNPNVPAGHASMRWAFGSFRLQAESAHKKIYLKINEARQTGNDPQGWGAVSVSYSADPCEPSQ
jgi:hypothetical protein